MPKGKKKHHRAAEKHYTDDEINIMTTAAIKKHSASVEDAAECP